MSKFRIEKDSMGELEVPANALYGAQTQRAVNNFPISGLTMPREFIKALGLIKAAAAEANLTLGHMPVDVCEAIKSAAEQIKSGEVDAHFPIDVFQTGSGTSSNMNCNEVISHLATTDALEIHPNDHVNMGQSSNDVIPTAIAVSCTLNVTQQLLPSMRHLITVCREKAEGLNDVVKTGRTHLMDAMPVTFGQELNTWASCLENNIARLEDALTRVSDLPQGGTAVGTGINADARFGALFAEKLMDTTGVPFSSMDNKFDGISTQDNIVELSGQLKVVATTMMKMANDLRWMNSGPLAGLGEIELPSLQPGSSIMPGKVNPVIPASKGIGGHRLSSYMFIIDDITNSMDGNIYELLYGPDWDISKRHISGKLNYMGTDNFASAGHHPGFEVFLEKRHKAYWVKDITKSLLIKPINPFTGREIYSSYHR